MSIFRWKQEKATEPYPFNLNKQQIDLLEDLTERASYTTFTRLLQDIAEYNGEAMLYSRDARDLAERQGFVKALRQIINLIPQIVEEAKRLDRERTRQRATENGQPDRSNFFGTGPWYDLAERVRRWGDRE